LVIDDLVHVMKVPRVRAHVGSAPSDRPDAKAVKAAEAAYDDVSLPRNLTKALRYARQALVLGGELDGFDGDLAAPRVKTLALCDLTLDVALGGIITRELLDVIVGSWIFVLLFRRCCLAILQIVFSEGLSRHPHEVFVMTSRLRHELLLLILLAPMFACDLRASAGTKLYAVDASPWAVGICSTPLPRPALQELWRVAERRGWHTRLLSTLGTYLEEHGARDAEASRLDRDTISPPLAEGVLWDALRWLEAGAPPMEH
jgi:hypothetical protein